MTIRHVVIFIDSDNSMGEGSGNVDDGFAIAALLLGGAPVGAIASVFGNAREAAADGNNRALAKLCGFRGPCLRGAARPRQASEASRFLAELPSPAIIAALGPLTNIAAAIRQNRRVRDWCAELVVVGSNTRSAGRWPPWWPYEFNLTADVAASRAVFASAIPWTIIPINLLAKLSVSRQRLGQLRGPIGDYIRRHSQRWLIRTYLRKWRRQFRVGDLIAAMLLLDRAAFRIEPVQANMHRNAWIDFRGGDKEVALVRHFDGQLLWERFVAIVNGDR